MRQDAKLLRMMAIANRSSDMPGPFDRSADSDDDPNRLSLCLQPTKTALHLGTGAVVCCCTDQPVSSSEATFESAHR